MGTKSFYNIKEISRNGAYLKLYKWLSVIFYIIPRQPSIMWASCPPNRIKKIVKIVYFKDASTKLSHFFWCPTSCSLSKHLSLKNNWEYIEDLDLSKWLLKARYNIKEISRKRAYLKLYKWLGVIFYIYPRQPSIMWANCSLNRIKK